MEATLEPDEYHPMADSAIVYVTEHLTPMIRESIASTALSGNRAAELCLSTINRLDSGQPVSDRYLLGLAWLVRDLVEGKP